MEIRHVPFCYDKTQLPSVFVTMGRKIKTDKIWLCASVGKPIGIGKQGKVKMNNINVNTIADELRIHTIADLQLL